MIKPALYSSKHLFGTGRCGAGRNYFAFTCYEQCFTGFPAYCSLSGSGRGPGQALNFGSVYEGYGFAGGKSFGLTIATVGFLVACIGGVIYLNILKTQKRLLDAESGEFTETVEEAIAPNDIPLTESIDKFTVQVAFVLGTYLFTFLVMFGLTAVIDTGILGKFGENTLKPLIWGFNFLFGTLFALLVKQMMFLLRRKNIVKRII